MLGREAGLLAQQRDGQCVGGDHHQHGNVEGHQRSEDKERAIVDDTHIRMGHYILLVHQTCMWKEREGESEKVWLMPAGLDALSAYPAP